MAIITPSERKENLAPNVPQAEPPGSHGAGAIAEGSAIGAAIGGIALAATAVVSGGSAFLPAIPVLVGGGAIAGGFSSLILSDGYGKGVGEFYSEASIKARSSSESRRKVRIPARAWKRRSAFLRMRVPIPPCPGRIQFLAD